MLGARSDGFAHPSLGARPPQDHNAHAVHELFGQIAHICLPEQRFLPRTRRAGTGVPLSAVNSDRHPGGFGWQVLAGKVGGGSLCDGASQLPAAPAAQRLALAV